MPFFYRTGEVVMVGGRVRIHGDSGHVELVADGALDPEDWYVKEFGGGVMVAAPAVFDHLFIQAPVSDYEDLEFVARAGIDPS